MFELMALKRLINPTTILAVCVAVLVPRCWYLGVTLDSERAANQAYRTQQAALAKIQRQQNAEALDFALDFGIAQEKEAKAKLDSVLKHLNKTVKHNEDLNEALTLSRINVERLRDYVRSNIPNGGTSETISNPESRAERDRTTAEDVRSLVAACAKTTIDFNKCKAREELVCGGRFPVKCSGEMP